MGITAAKDYASVLSQRVAAERLTLAGHWLGRLKELLTVEANDVFPSDQLLDHIPVLISEIAAYLRAPADEEIAANAAVIDKARELGALRHEQRASVHQLLREYEVLGDILQAFLVDETARLGLEPSSKACFDVFRRVTRAIATLMRTTVDTFVGEYTTTIQEQNDRLRAFNRAASHELRSPIGTILFAAGILERDHARVVHDEERLTKIASTVRTNAERLVWLVENLQRIARLSEPLDVPSQQRIEVDTIASEVARQLAEMATRPQRVDPRRPRTTDDRRRPGAAGAGAAESRLERDQVQQSRADGSVRGDRAGERAGDPIPRTARSSSATTVSAFPRRIRPRCSSGFSGPTRISIRSWVSPALVSGSPSWRIASTPSAGRFGARLRRRKVPPSTSRCRNRRNQSRAKHARMRSSIECAVSRGRPLLMPRVSRSRSASRAAITSAIS